MLCRIFFIFHSRTTATVKIGHTLWGLANLDITLRGGSSILFIFHSRTAATVKIGHTLRGLPNLDIAGELGKVCNVFSLQFEATRE